MGARIADKTVELEARHDDIRVRAPVGERASEGAVALMSNQCL